MAIGQRGAVCRHLQTIFGAGTVAGLSDAQLLERFANRGDSVAFEALVTRHGPLVLGVCRNVLRDAHAAEDAFQATFLVLARRAGAIRKPGSLAPWLHGVAYRVSVRARADSGRRRSVEREAVGAVRPDPSEGIDPDSRSAIQEEVHRLPERYRAAIVLCYFEGLTHDEAAHRLGWPVGTVRGRLSGARDLLRGRLARRGLAPSAGVIGMELGRSSARAAVPTALETTTIQAATRIAAGEAVTAGVCSATVASLTRGALRTMMLTKLKLAGAALLIAACTTTGAGVLAHQAGEKDGESSASAEPGELKSRSSQYAPREEEPARNVKAPVIDRQTDERLTKIEATLQAIQKQSEAIQNEFRNARASKLPGPNDKFPSPEELDRGVQEIQAHRAEEVAEISTELESAKARVEKLRLQLSKAEKFASELGRLHDDLIGNNRPRPVPSVVPSPPQPFSPAVSINPPRLATPEAPPSVIFSPSHPQPPDSLPQPVQPTQSVSTPGIDQSRDRRLDRLEQMMQRLLEQRGTPEPSSRGR